MISISDALEEIIQNQPFIEEGLSRGIVNLSAYAREIKPQIEERLFKDIKEGAVVMALKRLSEKLANKKRSKNAPIFLSDLTVKSNLSEYTFENSETLLEKQRRLFEANIHKKDAFFTFTQGIRETTLIASSDISDDIKRIFAGENIISCINNLSSITIKTPKEMVYTPGVDYAILKRLAWENINIIEILSTYTELTIIFDDKDVEKAFSVLKKISTIS